MYYAEVDDYFVRDDAVYYHVVGKLDMAPILLTGSIVGNA